MDLQKNPKYFIRSTGDMEIQVRIFCELKHSGYSCNDFPEVTL